MRDEVGPVIGRLLTPRHYDATPAAYPWAADNDGFNGVDIPRYMRMLGAIAGREGCLFVTAPDVLHDASTTLELFMRWQPIIRECGMPAAYVLQNGLQGVGVPWNFVDALFIGGDTAFKYTPLVSRVVREAKDRGKWVHMGRVNTIRRLRYAASIGCDSVDGSKWARFTDTYLPQLHMLQYEQGALA